MKKTSLLLAALIATAALVGCNRQDAAPTGAGTTPGAPASAASR
jgi:predicted small secreted protein